MLNVYTEKLLAPRATRRLEDHNLSAVSMNPQLTSICEYHSLPLYIGDILPSPVLSTFSCSETCKTPWSRFGKWRQF